MAANYAKEKKNYEAILYDEKNYITEGNSSSDEAYTLPFRVVICGLAAVGVILTPIYLLSMLREIFFGKEKEELVSHTNLVDAEPREVYIIGCLLVPIIGIG